MMPSIIQSFILAVSVNIIIVAAGFPLESPCLKTCGVEEDIAATTLQKCINLCNANGHCDQNRLTSDCTSSSNKVLSCANGCEMAYYRSTKGQCYNDCQKGAFDGCWYKHPNILNPFLKCGACTEGCDSYPDKNSCRAGCDFAAQLPEFYKYKETTCTQDNTPRFLFAGQSNMEGWPTQSLPGKYVTIMRTLNKKTLPDWKIKRKLERLFMRARSADPYASANEARILVEMKSHLKKSAMFFNHPNITCSLTQPNLMGDLDCERPVSSTACGGKHDQYGPELTFSHVFQKLESPFKGQKISIAKVTVGGTQLNSNWMQENKDEYKNYWNALADAIKGAQGTIEAFVWFQGENDSFKDWNKENYLDHLTTFINDVRHEIYSVAPSSKFSSPTDIPVVIVELGQWIWNGGREIIFAQRAFVENDPNAILVKTGAGDDPEEKLSSFYHYDPASQMIIGERIAVAMATILNQNANI